MRLITSKLRFPLKLISITLILLSLRVFSYGASITAVQNGNWSNPINWSLGRIPVSGDAIIIPTGRFVIYDFGVTLSGGGSLTINGPLCGVYPVPFTISCGCYFTCNGLMSGNVINVADGMINQGGSVYVLDTFIYTPCSTGFNNSGSIINGQPSSCFATAIGENYFALMASIFPNPFSADLTVTVSENIPSEIVLYDVFSREILKRKFSESIILNTEQFVRGIYFYQIRNKNGLLKQGKLVRN